MTQVQFLAEAGTFLFTTASRPSLESTQPLIQWILGTLSMGVKWVGHEADYSHSFSAEVKNAWCKLLPLLPHTSSWHGTAFMHRDNFTLPYLTLPYLT